MSYNNMEHAYANILVNTLERQVSYGEMPTGDRP